MAAATASPRTGATWPSRAESLAVARRFYRVISGEWHDCAQCGDPICPRARNARGSQAGEYVCSARCARERHAQLTWEGR